jgi:hypothetical protein
MVINSSLIGLAIAQKNMTPMAGLMPLFAPMVLLSAYLRKEKEAVAV